MRRFRVALVLAMASLLTLAWSALTMNTNTASAESTLFFSGLENNETQPTWNNTIEYSQNVTSSSLSKRTGEQQLTGSYSLLIAGTDNSASASYGYFKVFDVNIPVNSNTVLEYWLYPQQDNGRYVGVDLVFTDGTVLRNLGATDYNGYSTHPASGHGSQIQLNKWSQIKSDIGRWTTGKTIDRIQIAYDRAPSTGSFSAYLDNIKIADISSISAPDPNKEEYTLTNKSFEDSGTALTGWSTFGNASLYTTDGYYGTKSTKLYNTASSAYSSMWQSVSLGTGVGQPRIGDSLEAGVWAYFAADADFTLGNFYIEVESVDAAGNKTPIAKSPLSTTSTPKGHWVYFKTQPINGGKVLPNATTILISLQNGVRGTSFADFVQVGDVGATNGNPSKMVLAVEEPWFGNATVGWKHWAWSGGPTGYNHDPNTILANGQRDIATTYYPKVGAYDSLDSNLINWKIDIAKAMAIDCIVADFYGPSVEPRLGDVITSMINASVTKDMKLFVMYEPRVHFNGWISYPPSATRQDRINGVQNDLKYILDTWSGSKGYLSYDGAPIIGIFSMAYDMTSSEWASIYNNLVAMGYKLTLIGDAIQTSDYANWYPTFRGMFAWSIYDSTLAESVNPQAAAVYNKATSLNNLAKNWAAAGSGRFPIGMVWPGFDDTGVGSWGTGNIRKTPFWNGGFYDQTLNAAVDSNLNWALVATLSDWNESTTIEPTKENGYSWAIRTQNFAERFKGIPAIADSQMQTITEAYLNNPNAAKFQ